MASALPSSGDATELDRLRTLVSSYFPVYETRVGPQSVLFAVHLDPASLESRFDDLRQNLWARRYVPILRRQGGEDFVEVVRRPTVKPFAGWVNIGLLAATIATTSFAGSLIYLAYVGGTNLGWSDVGYGMLYFALPVMTILGLHELAHFAVARRHHVEASLPFFMPIPPPFLFGTFGAFISIREPFPDKKALFDIGAAGPLAGFAASIPIALAGLYLSIHAPVLPLTYCGPTVLGVSYGNLLIGTPLFWYGLSLFFPPSVVSLSPLALAGWVGLLVTAINLLPAGQLDGGHVFRALFGDRSRYLSYAIVVVLFGIGLLYYTGWLFFGIVVLFLGARHPPPLNDLSPLDVKRYAVGAFVAAVLVTGFVLTPIASPPGQIALPQSDQSVVYPAPPPGAAIAAQLSVTIVNQDPVAHGFLVATSVVNVSVGNRSSPTYLSGAALAAWTANSTWVYQLPNGTEITLHGGSVALPSSDYVTINGSSSSAVVLIGFSNPAPAVGAIVNWQTTEFCATTGGSATTSFSLSWA
ncbi:MAG TPA: site-2 protease family protein [Thermoplasmata archaeon]|nr:site-2 protease family protein [Thermoplasmata archaeon]